jgi:hypothetical protein
MQTPLTLPTPPTQQKQSVPPSCVAPVKVKTEPIEMVEDKDKEAITTFKEDGELDVKPTIGVKIERYEGKRKQSLTPKGKDIKPVVPGSRDMPIAIKDVEEIDKEDATIASPSTLTPPTWQQQFIPPSRIAPVKVKTEPIKIKDNIKPITTFEEDGQVDVKPIIGMEIERYEGKRKQSSMPKGKDIKQRQARNSRFEGHAN